VTKVRFLRAKVRYRLTKYEEAQEDAEQVLKELPDIKGGKELLAKIREHVKPPSVTIIGGAAKYSEWQWSWTIPGDKSFAVADYRGGEGHTLFYWAARPGERDEVEKLELDASDQRLYFLRIVSLKGADGKADLRLPAATEHKVMALPYMLLVDGAGTEVARGKPDEVTPKLDAIKKVKKEAAAPSDPVTHVDFAQNTGGPETLGRAGYTTVVMVSSPG
jgi:hypothetical protein